MDPGIMMPIFLILCWGFVGHFLYPFISCLPDQPLVREVKQAMPPDVFADMQVCVPCPRAARRWIVTPDPGCRTVAQQALAKRP